MKLWWYVARASGIVAWVLLGVAVIWGLLLATRLLGSKPRPAWVLDLHRWLGGLAVSFTAVHLAGLAADDYVDFGLRQLFVPLASSWRPAAVAWGVVAFYLLAAVQVTSLLMKRLPLRLWKWIHMSSFALFFVATMHAGMAGTDTGNRIYRTVTVTMVAGVVFFTVYRIIGAVTGGRRSRSPSRPNREPQPTGLVN